MVYHHAQRSSRSSYHNMSFTTFRHSQARAQVYTCSYMEMGMGWENEGWEQPQATFKFCGRIFFLSTQYTRPWALRTLPNTNNEHTMPNSLAPDVKQMDATIIITYVIFRCTKHTPLPEFRSRIPWHATH